MNEVVNALKGLLRHVDINTCLHEETKRGGTIWTICCQCERMWADDEGGFVPRVDAPEVATARRVLAYEVSTLSLAEVAYRMGRDDLKRAIAEIIDKPSIPHHLAR